MCVTARTLGRHRLVEHVTAARKVDADSNTGPHVVYVYVASRRRRWADLRRRARASGVGWRHALPAADYAGYPGIPSSAARALASPASQLVARRCAAVDRRTADGVVMELPRTVGGDSAARDDLQHAALAAAERAGHHEGDSRSGSRCAVPSGCARREKHSLAGYLKSRNVAMFGQYVFVSKFPIVDSTVGDISYDGETHTYLRARLDVKGRRSSSSTRIW